MPLDLTPVLVSSARTPLGRFGGAYAGTSALDLGAAAVSAAVERASGLVPEHVYLGNVLQAGLGQNPARSVAMRAGLPTTVPATTLNDVCLAGLSATGIAASLIRAGEISSAVVGGFDSMSTALHGARLRSGARLGDVPLIDLLTRDGLWCALADEAMGPMAERSNRELGVDRRDQDALAAESHRRAAMARTSGRWEREIVPFGGLTHDEGVRPDTTIGVLSTLRSAFTTDGTITAGNASQLSDGASAGVLMSARGAAEEGLDATVQIVGRAVIAGPDYSLHLKPALAARRLLERHGMSPGDVDLWEINEAFAGVVIASARDLDLDLDAVNVNGGAIALGHPLAGSGFRILSTLAHELRARGLEHGVATMCGGGGQGEAILLRIAG